MLTTIILTYNEEQHIARCIKSLQACSSRICIVDSYSTDATCDIAHSLGAEVFQNKWENNHAKQWNWAFTNCNIQTPWVMRMDADEYLLPELSAEIVERLPVLESDVGGVELTRRVVFKGKWLKHGGFYPITLLRIFRPEWGHCEQRLMDEHIVLSQGKVIQFAHDLVDENLNTMHWWVIKHNNYARREAADLLNQKYGMFTQDTMEQSVSIKQASRKRFLKEKVYAKLPMGVRPMLYFKFRFFIQLGILDGPKGWLFHFLQGFWYRLMVDVNVWEFEKATEGMDSAQRAWYIRDKWGIELG
jgi:glycosyltransferase involved in cell wall biosynthesis